MIAFAILISYYEIHKELLSGTLMLFCYELTAGLLPVPLYTLPIICPPPPLHPNFWNQPFYEGELNVIDVREDMGRLSFASDLINQT